LQEKSVPVVNYRLDGNVAVLEIDNPPVNATSLEVRQGLAEALKDAASDPVVEAVVITGTPVIFLVGADIKEISSGANNTPPTLRDLQTQIEAVPKPIVAAIRGSALGGGFELALTCHWRIAAADAKVGLPEVKLGILPGAGGTQRFTRLAGAEAALDSITSGNPIAAKRALELGLIDALADDVMEEAIVFARPAAGDQRPLRLASDLTDKITGIDPAVFTNFRKKLESKARGQLAPWKIIDCIEAACARPKDEAFQFERDAFNECRDSPQRKALIHLFFAEREARKIPDLPADTKALPIRSAAIVGAGTMGGGIAMNFANAGIPVQLLELNQDAVDRGLGLIQKNYAASVKRGSSTEAAMERALSLIKGVTQYEAVGAADIVIEAVFEDMQVKKDVFTRLDRVCAPHAILATNTSSLDIDAIAEVTSRPGSVIGTHFFSPANVMKLLENVRSKHSSAQTIVTAMSLGKLLNKVVVLAGNCDGFIGNRMLQFYTGEAEFLLEEGATPEQIDRVMEGFGFAMGPLAVRDLAGNDVGYSIRKARKVPADERFSPILQRVFEAGRLGQKTGRGFYRYEGRTRICDPEIMTLIEGVSRDLGITRREIPDEEILMRLLCPLVNEGAKIVDEGIAIRASDVDIVYVNGYGFPACKGGPMFWAQEFGFDQVIATMQKLAPTHGQRWKPAPLLERLAASGKGWADAAKSG
jgi:3-hydroxyacyl-CoA dehydrogenase